MKPALITFCGTGGTGKTSVLRGLEKQIDADTLQVFPSVVRGFYKSRGVPDQAAFYAMPPDQQFTFQYDLLVYYVETLEQAYADCQKRFLVSDRSIYDHFGYFTVPNQRAISQSFWKDKIAPLVARFNKMRPLVLFFSMHTPWYTIETIADGFRSNTYGTELVLDALMRRYVDTYHDWQLVFEMPVNGTINERVEFIVTEVLQFADEGVFL